MAEGLVDRLASQPPALGQPPGGRQNDRAALPGSRRRCCSCAARTGVEVGIYSGALGGVTAPTKNFVPVTMVEIRLDLGASVRQDLPLQRGHCRPGGRGRHRR